MTEHYKRLVKGNVYSFDSTDHRGQRNFIEDVVFMGTEETGGDTFITYKYADSLDSTDIWGLNVKNLTRILGTLQGDE